MSNMSKLVTLIKHVFNDKNKYYPQVLLENFFGKLIK